VSYSLQQLRAVAEIAESVSVSGSEMPNETLALVCGASRADAAMLLVWNRETDRHRLVASHGYPDALLEYVPTGMMDDELFTVVRRAGRALCIDAPQAPIDFRKTHHYLDHIRPAGFRDGMSCPLGMTGGRYVGMLHLSAERPAFGKQEQALVDALARQLARACDGLHPPAMRARTVFIDAIGAVITPAGHEPTALGDAIGPVLEGADRLLASSAATVTFLARPYRRLHRFELQRMLPGFAADPVVRCRHRPTELPFGLTPRELTILTGLTTGLTNSAIAAALTVSPRTVSTHVERVLIKLGCSSRAGAAALAVRDQLFDLSEPRLRAKVWDLLLR
jgi:DNA-binding NarL/FixJ family response regulator